MFNYSSSVLKQTKVWLKSSSFYTEFGVKYDVVIYMVVYPQTQYTVHVGSRSIRFFMKI